MVLLPDPVMPITTYRFRFMALGVGEVDGRDVVAQNVAFSRATLSCVREESSHDKEVQT